jgi:hypothetical protein
VLVSRLNVTISRDRLSFSKSILPRLIRGCVDRDAAVASPWTVKPAIDFDVRLTDKEKESWHENTTANAARPSPFMSNRRL